MDQLSFLLVVLAERLFRPRHSVRLQILQVQIRFLRSRIDTSRIVPSPDEKHELLRLGALLGHDVADVMHIVQPETCRCWLRKKAHGGAFKRSGRPRINELLHGLILRLGVENVRWGYRRVVGELKKLGLYVSATTVRKVLRESGTHPPRNGDGTHFRFHGPPSFTPTQSPLSHATSSPRRSTRYAAR